MKKISFFWVILGIQLSLSLCTSQLDAMKRRSQPEKKSSRPRKKTAHQCLICNHDPFSAPFVLHEHMLNEHRACCDCDYALPEAEFNNHQAVYKFARHVADKHKRNSVYYLNALVGGNPTITLRVGVARNNAKALSKRNNVVIDEREFHVHQNQELQCLECEKFLSESYYDEHIMRVHKVCPWCKNQVKHATIKTLVEHVQQEHPEKSIFSCEHCQEFVSLDEDLASAHTQEACYKETNNHKFQCAVPGCNRSFSKTDSAGYTLITFALYATTFKSIVQILWMRKLSDSLCIYMNNMAELFIYVAKPIVMAANASLLELTKKLLKNMQKLMEAAKQ